MPLTLEWFDDGRTVHCVGSGDVTRDEVIAVKRTLLERPETRQMERVLVLLDETATLNVSAADVAQFAAIDSDLAKLAPHAAIAVAAIGAYAYAIAQMWRVFALRTHWRIGVFRSERDAAAWLESPAAAGA